MPTSTASKTPAKAPKTGEKTAVTVATKVGVVESDKRDKSRTVVVNFKVMHAKYGKYLNKRSVLQVHDENNESHVGDTVEIKPCRPLSKTKRWTLVRIVGKSTRVELITQ